MDNSEKLFEDFKKLEQFYLPFEQDQIEVVVLSGEEVPQNPCGIT